MFCKAFDIESMFVQCLVGVPCTWIAYKMFFAFLDALHALTRYLLHKAIQAERRLHAMRLKQIENDKLQG